MSEAIRRLTAAGIDRFRDYLKDLREDGSLPMPEDLTDGPDYSEVVPGGPVLDRPGFVTKRHAAEYLAEALEPIHDPSIMTDAGLWSWLAVYYFDDVCPSRNGERTPKADPHYILDAQNHKRIYRHLLRTPYQIINAMPDHNRIYLEQPLDVHGEIVEQTISKLYLIRLKPVRELVDRIYVDESTQKIKRGLFNKRENAKPGDLRNRLPTRLQQLQKTYDLAGLSGDQLFELLGSEFERWATA